MATLAQLAHDDSNSNSNTNNSNTNNNNNTIYTIVYIICVYITRGLL